MTTPRRLGKVAGEGSVMSLAKRWARRSTAIAAVSGMVITAGAVLAPLSESSDTTQVVATAGVNIRSGPGTQHTIVGSLARGKSIQTLGSSQNGWTPVSLNGQKRWIASQYLASAQRYEAATSAPTTGTATTTAGLNARTGPSMGSSVATVLPRGTSVTLTGQASGEWRQIRHGSRTLWVSARYLATGAGGSSSAPPPVTSTPASTARTTAALNARTGAGLQYRVAVVLSKGASVSLTGQASGEWRQIKHGSQSLWVSSRYLTTSGSSSGGSSSSGGGASAPSAGALPKVVGTRYATVALNIRTASSGGSTITTVPAGAALQITGVTQNGREQVVYQGAVRWVTAGYLASSAPSSGGGSSVGLSGLRPSAAAIVAESRTRFPQITTYYGVRPDSLPDHPSGRAVDIMLPNYRSASSKALGKEIAEWAKANASRLNVEYIIWDQHIWSVARSREGWRWMASRGSDTANHKDHVHITVRS